MRAPFHTQKKPRCPPERKGISTPRTFIFFDGCLVNVAPTLLGCLWWSLWFAFAWWGWWLRRRMCLDVCGRTFAFACAWCLVLVAPNVRDVCGGILCSVSGCWYFLNKNHRKIFEYSVVLVVFTEHTFLERSLDTLLCRRYFRVFSGPKFLKGSFGSLFCWWMLVVFSEQTFLELYIFEYGVLLAVFFEQSFFEPYLTTLLCWWYFLDVF